MNKLQAILLIGVLLIGSTIGGAWAVATITGLDIVDGSIKSIDIGDKSVANIDLATDAVDGNKVKNLSIKNGDLGDSIVTSPKIKDGTITSFDLADNGIFSEDIKDGTILRYDIASGILPVGATNILYGSCNLDVVVEAHSYAQGVCPPNFADGSRVVGLRVDDHVVATLNNNSWPEIVLTSVSTDHDCEPEEDCIISYILYNLGDEDVNVVTGFGESFDFVAWNQAGDDD